MRITRNQLQDLINEEISLALLRVENRRLVEEREPGGDLYDIDAFSLLKFAKAYVSLGRAIQEQLESLVNTGGADVNLNAFELMERNLRGMNREIDHAFDEWHRNNGEDTL